MKAEKIKVNISISPKIKELTQDKIDIFGGNFSAYITHLIIEDTKTDTKKPRKKSGCFRVKEQY